MPTNDRQPNKVSRKEGRSPDRERAKKSAGPSKKASLKDAQTSRELLELVDWNPFVRVDGSILEKLHKKQLLATTGEALW